MTVAGAFLTAAAQDGHKIGPVCEITLLDATWRGSATLNLSSGIASARGKGYVPRILEWDDPGYGFDILGSNLTPLEVSVTVQDEDLELQTALETGDQRGSAVAWYWVVPGSATDYAQRFAGILDSWEYKRGSTILHCRTDDSALRTQLPNWALLRSEWPLLPSSEIGKYAPLPYGTLNSAGLTGTGQIKLIPVALVGSWSGTPLVWTGTTGVYLVCLGEAKSVKAVYVAGLLKTITTHYTISYSTAVAGRTYTLVTFTAGNIPSDKDAVTADVDGYEASGNTGSGTTAPTGALILNPVAQMRHLIVNHAEARYQTGAWGTATSLLDETSWAAAEAWAASRKLEGAGFVGGSTASRSVGDELNRWLDTWRSFRACWTFDGRIGLYPIDLAWPGYRSATSDVPVLRREHERGDGLSYTLDPSEIADAVVGAYLYDEAAGAYAGSMTCYDPSIGENVSTQVEMPWSIRRAV